MTTSPPPAGPRTQQIPTGEGATAAGLAGHPGVHAVPPSVLPAPAYPVTTPQPATTPEPAHHSPPAHHAPLPHEPVHHQPAHFAPAHHAPTHHAPAHHAPTHHAPAHHAPLPHEPVHHAPAGHQQTGPQATGPLDSLLGAPPVPPPAAVPQKAPAARPEKPARPRAPRRPRDRAALVGAGLAGLGLVLLELGLALRLDGPRLWGQVPAWAAFATVCALLGGVAALSRLVPALRLRPLTAERLALGGAAGLAVFWVLVVLPHADTDRGFLLTAALGAVALAAWLVPGRRR
ncbi:hypothetical protein ACI79J_12165 [Geodermatophilus sp. SYSU D01062]